MGGGNVALPRTSHGDIPTPAVPLSIPGPFARPGPRRLIEQGFRDDYSVAQHGPQAKA